MNYAQNLFIVFVYFAAGSSFAAGSPSDVLKEQESVVAFAIEHQSEIDALDDETRRTLARYQNELERIGDLEAYNENLREMMASQQTEAARLETALGEVEIVKRDIVPLMLEMSDVLRRLVSVDAPFLERERTRRVEDVSQTLSRADIEIGEKYRRVIEAYLIEAECG